MRNSQEMQENDIENPSPFKGRESNPNKRVQITEFTRWVSQLFLYHPTDVPDHPITNSAQRKIKTIKYYIVYVPPKKGYNDSFNSNKDNVCFWTENFIVPREKSIEIDNYIKSIFSSVIPTPFISPMINQSCHDVVQQIRQLKIQSNQRLFFHYIGNHLDNPPNDGLEFSQNIVLQLTDLLKICGKFACFVFDRDNAGNLLPTFLDYVNSTDSNIFAFFSCRQNEFLPHSSDYPVDIFTSCLNSPARIALAWHSRHYYCFQSGPLKPISLLFLEKHESGSNDNEKVRIKMLLDDLTRTLRSIVEAMCVRMLTPEQFCKFFRTDKVLNRISINFILACRILHFFNIHPVSYPRLPDMNNAYEWHTFDLRLDAALYLLNHPEEDGSSALLSQHCFLSQILSTFHNKLTVTRDINGNTPSPFELSFFKSILKDPQLSNEASMILAKYLDSSSNAIVCSLYYPIPKTLFKLLAKSANRKPSKFLLFCLIKILAYHEPSRALILNCKKNDQIFIKKVLIDSLKSSSDVVDAYDNGIHLLTQPKSNTPSPLPQSTTREDRYRNRSRTFSYHTHPTVQSCKITENLNQRKNAGSDISQFLDNTIVFNLALIILSLIMKHTYQLFHESIIDAQIFSQSVIDDLDEFSKTWLLFIIGHAASGVNEPMLLKKFLTFFFKICNSNPKSNFQSSKMALHHFQSESTILLPPTLHAVAVWTLSNFIKPSDLIQNIGKSQFQAVKLIEQTATEYAFNFSYSTLINVRIELSILAQKYRKANPNIFNDITTYLLSSGIKDEDTHSLFTKTNLFIQHRKNDPSPLVRNASESHFFNYFVSALLHPIEKITSSTFSFDQLFSQPKTKPTLVQTLKPSQFNLLDCNDILTRNLIVNSIYCHENIITSTLIHLPDYHIAFGDEAGKITIQQWDNPALRTLQTISSSPITNLHFISNSNNPLLFSVNSDHNVIVSKINNDYQLSANGVFSIYQDDRITIDSKRGILFSYKFNKGNEFHIRDLTTDQFLPSIKPKYSPTNCICPISYFDDVIALCGSAFECFDLRQSIKEPVISIYDVFDTQPISMTIVNESILTFAIALQGHTYVDLDIRIPEQLKSIPIPCMCLDNEKVTKGFAINKQQMMAAISHEHGITCIKMCDRRNFLNDVKSNPKIGLRVESPSELLFHPEKYELAFVNDYKSIMIAI